MSDPLIAPRSADAAQPERRAFGRRTMFRQATAVVLGGARWPCFVVDKSEVGARLKVKDLLEFPDTFKLVIEDDNQVVHCQVVRRTPEFIAVEFVATPKLADTRVANNGAAPAARFSTIRKKPLTVA
jgi:hypothetical protein